MFVEGSPRWEQSSFLGRLRHFTAQVDPRFLLYSWSQLDKCKEMLAEHRNNPTLHSEKSLWKAQYALYARIHPDTGDWIPINMCMPGFIPACLPICALMVMPGTSPFLQSCYQATNQSMNAGFNYFNRNATKETTIAQMVVGYVGAVTVAVGTATGLRNLIRNSPRIPGHVKVTMGTFLSFPASAAANMANVILMRNGELFNGIEVFNKDGTSAGVSHTAARQAIWDTALTRIVMPIPVFVLPPAGAALVERFTSLFTRFPKSRLPVTVLLSTLGLYIGIPLAVACFPQNSAMCVSKLEDTCTPTGSLVYYNKGL